MGTRIILLAVLLGLSGPVLSAEFSIVGNFGFNAVDDSSSCKPITQADMEGFDQCDLTVQKAHWPLTNGVELLPFRRCISAAPAEYFVFESPAACQRVAEGHRQSAGLTQRGADKAALTAQTERRIKRQLADRMALAECQVLDGLWTHGGGLRAENAPMFCQLPLPDGGKACKSGTDCKSGSCLSRKQFPDGETAGQVTTGACTRYPVGGGCVARVEKGRAQAVVCTD